MEALAPLALLVALLGGSPGARALGLPAEEGVDSTVAPGDDFFAFANGAWLKATSLPPGKGRWGARNEIAERSALQLAQVVQEAAAAGPGGRAVADFHAAYLDRARIESLGLAPLRPLLRRIDALPNKAALARWLGSQLRADVDPLGRGIFDSQGPFGLAVSFGVHGEPNPSAYLLQGGLGLPGRDAYLDSSSAAQALRLRYQASIAGVLQQAGYGQAASRAAAVLALETALAQCHASAADSARDENAEQRWRRGDFALKAPGLDWPAFFAAAGLAGQPDIVAWQPGAIQGTAALVASQPLAVWKDYLRWQLLLRHADVLPQALAEAAGAWRATAGGGPAALAQRAVAATSEALPDAVARLYVQRHFPAEARARVQAILGQVVAAFGRRVEAAPWLSAASKAVAQAKLQTLYFGVGHPDPWPDDPLPRLDARDAAGNLQRVAESNRRRALARLGKPVDRRDWAIAPQTSGAILNFQINAYNFAAALLQPPKFEPDAPEALNYGAIGAVFAHELSHFVDTLGADYDALGATRHWWTAADHAGYDAAVSPLVAQFAAYRPFPDVAVDGRLTLVENVADLGGLATAFDAYRAALGSRAASPEDLRRQDRLFFIGFARSWRVRFNDDGLRAQLKDGHAPENFRVATVRNIDAWYEAFDVRPGQRLYLPPAERVRIW